MLQIDAGAVVAPSGDNLVSVEMEQLQHRMAQLEEENNSLTVELANNKPTAPTDCGLDDETSSIVSQLTVQVKEYVVHHLCYVSFIIYDRGGLGHLFFHSN